MAGHITRWQADRGQETTGSTPYAVLSTRQSSLVLSPCHLTLPFSQHHQMVCQPAGKAFLGSVRPDDVDGIHPFRLPQAEVSERVRQACLRAGREHRLRRCRRKRGRVPPRLFHKTDGCPEKYRETDRSHYWRTADCVPRTATRREG